MIIFKKAQALSQFIRSQKNDGKLIGFVPTMGALHDGHTSLVDISKKTNDVCVCSIFINPSQFNNPEDFKHYPVTLENDIERLLGVQCDVLFLPPVSEIYPNGYKEKHYHLGKLELILEGKYRPGHFQGVCRVIDRLLELVSPHTLYLGQKDFQQCLVIRHLLKLLGKSHDIDLQILDTIREKDGLALSSRNLRLNPMQRMLAPSLYLELKLIEENLVKIPFDSLKKNAEESLLQKGFEVDYVEIAHVKDLSKASNTFTPLIALVAASIGNIRLIDNLLLNRITK